MLLALCLDNQAHVRQIHRNLGDSLLQVVNVVFFAESLEVVALLLEAALHFEDVKQCCPAEFFGVGSQQDVVFCLLGQGIGKFAGSVKVEVFE